MLADTWAVLFIPQIGRDNVMSGYSKSPDWSGIIIGVIIGVLFYHFVING